MMKLLSSAVVVASLLLMTQACLFIAGGIWLASRGDFVSKRNDLANSVQKGALTPAIAKASCLENLAKPDPGSLTPPPYGPEVCDFESNTQPLFASPKGPLKDSVKDSNGQSRSSRQPVAASAPNP